MYNKFFIKDCLFLDFFEVFVNGNNLKIFYVLLIRNMIYLDNLVFRFDIFFFGLYNIDIIGLVNKIF